MLTRRSLMIGGGAAACLASVSRLMAFEPPVKPALQFRGQDYFIRQVKSNDTAYLFTPRDQPDLTKRTDLFSIVTYRDVKDFEQLRAQKDKVLKTYNVPGAVILGQKDAPPSLGFRGESFFCAMQGGNGFSDATFARFTLASGIGYALIYMRSIYDAGQGNAATDSADALGKWINTNSREVSSALLDFTIVLNDSVLAAWKSSVAQSSN